MTEFSITQLSIEWQMIWVTELISAKVRLSVIPNYHILANFHLRAVANLDQGAVIHTQGYVPPLTAEMLG